MEEFFWRDQRVEQVPHPVMPCDYCGEKILAKLERNVTLKLKGFFMVNSAFCKNILNKMNSITHVKEGLQNLYFSKLRSILALLGVLVGTASVVVAMVLGGELATNEALRQFKTLGTDLLAVSIEAASEDSGAAGKNGKFNVGPGAGFGEIR